MANERKTENIVRNHFKQYLDDILIEEQSSDVPKIKKLLIGASKGGIGQGFPEFVIQYKNNPDLLIVIECKADASRHESNDRLQYKNYSVDGVLLYSSYLSKDYDVLSIAVSGENERELKVSHFLQLKGEKRAVVKFSNKLLSPADYLQEYLKSPEKFRQDYDKLLTFSKELNDNMHTLQIKEDLRALLISAILIALDDSAFKKAYKDYTDAKQLARFLIDTTLNQFEKAKLQNAKIEDLKVVYQQITIIDGLISDIKNIKELITGIDENINDFIRTHEYFDVLGQLYIEFLRYANSDKGLGIVLTPPHITEFMSQLAEVNKDSVVYDSCTGTGGFLVSAMKLMIDDAKGDSEKIKEIKAKKLIGVENKSHIFALACSNMFIHQDGKTNILNGSCFDSEVMEKVKQCNPTVGLLNPPYKSDKKKDIEELDFILNNLECVEQGGKTVAIVPMQTALAQTGKIFELKNKILENHTLEAVLSMPDELFFNSKVGVVSCIMVFTAKRPHPKNKKTFFGYFKKDGFEKRKNKGRIDVYGNWEKIKESWITAYLNKENIPGLSVNVVVDANDEWCAEAYMETDYQTLSEKDFEKSVKDFVAFLVSNDKC